ncbi:hypothetical protein [Chelativorans sp. YIM 93263]|uniref:hypothetical protein n=1 Tax=Chelativorans sp. YIM 93263 TaxID=2906648 RepID=UPI002379FF56|nr:hypothetical protein [Chelativorans sp. YIM 93263]
MTSGQVSPQATARATEAQRLQKIRVQYAAIAPGDWSLAADSDGMLLEARGDAGELNCIVRFSEGATSEEMEFVADAPRHVDFLLGLVDRAIAALRDGGAPAQDRGKAKDYAAEAAMKCHAPAFKAYLEARHGLERPLTDERAASRLRSVLGVTSRKELNESSAAAQRWKQLRADFEAWRRAG